MNPPRHLLGTLSTLAAAAVLLAGCGFKPVSTAALPFETLYVSGGNYASFGGVFKRFVESYSRTTRIADTQGSADATVEILSERQEKQILSLNASGRVQEYLLRYRVSFRVVDRTGRVLIPPDDIVLERDLTYDDDAVLAKENEEAFLYRDMQMDAVQQLVRRLSQGDFTAATSAAGG
jgi:LPS-assembly lipoprotein